MEINVTCGSYNGSSGCVSYNCATGQCVDWGNTSHENNSGDHGSSLQDYGLVKNSDKVAAQSTPYSFEIYEGDSEQCVSTKEWYNIVSKNIFDSNQKFMSNGDLFLGIMLEKIQLKKSTNKIKKYCKPLNSIIDSNQSTTTPLNKIYNKEVLKTMLKFALYSPYTFSQLLFIPPEIRSDGHFIYLKSPDGKYTLNGQNDGNLVIYGPTGPIWCTDHNVYKRNYGKSLFLSHDGRIHWCWGDEHTRWSSNVSRDNSGAPYKLSLSNDGAMTVKDKINSVLWSSR
jgi:hypothetical protein